MVDSKSARKCDPGFHFKLRETKATETASLETKILGTTSLDTETMETTTERASREEEMNELKCHQLLLYNRLRHQKELLEKYMKTSRSVDLVNTETTNMERLFADLCDTNIMYRTYLHNHQHKHSMEWLTFVDTEVFELKQRICAWLLNIESKYKPPDLPLDEISPLKEGCEQTKASSYSTPLLNVKDPKSSRERKPSLRRRIFKQKIEKQLEEYKLKSVSESNLDIGRELPTKRMGKGSASTKW